MFKEECFEYVLKSLRVRQGKMWTQARMAQSLGVSLRTYVKWENGESLPQSHDLKHIAATLRLSDTDSEALFHAAGSPAPKMQNLPFAPNPFFTGRQNELLQMSRLFEKNERIAISQPISVSGLGGIGKTQLALEYAHRSYPDVYHSVFFVNAADRASLAASYLSLAQLLQLPEKNEREVERIVQAVKVWLEEHTHWLLILDNADNLELARSYLPTKPRGHILLTTRSQIVGTIATLIQVETLSPAEGLLFLLRRSGVLPSGTEVESIAADIRHAAGEVVAMLAGHPLALDQAGAYIEETSDPETQASSASFTEYRQLYQEQRRLLLQRRGELGGGHPDSIALTFEISVQKACERHPKCAEVLAFCSLLHPDAIPEELLHQSLSLDQFHLNEVIRALRSYSLIKRNVEKQVVSLHRLVQAVIRDGMDRPTVQQWTECVVQVLNDAFPEVTFEEWKRCERYLPHALICVNTPLHEMVPPPQTSSLLDKAGTYLRERGQYQDAEPLLVRALALREQSLGPDHPDTAASLNSLATLYWQQEKHEQAEPLYQRALSIREQHLGATHPDTAKSLNNLASLSYRQGKYEQAEPLYQRALSIFEQHLGAEHPDTARSLNGLASLYCQQGKYKQAEPLYQRTLAIRERHLGETHPDTAMSLHNLAILYHNQGKYEQAEPLFLRALSIFEQHLGAEHPETAMTLNNLAHLYRQQNKYEQAEPLYQRALSIFEQHLGAEHPDTARSLNNLAHLYRQQNKYEQAEPLYQRALSIFEQHLGAEHPDTARSLNGLASLYCQQGKYEQAEPLYLQALAIWEQHLGTEHPDTAAALHNLAELYWLQGKYEQAEPLYKRALSILEQHLGPEHPFTAEVLHGLAELYQQQGKYEQAEPLYLRALAIREQHLGPEHSDTAKTLHGLAELYRQQGKYEQAEPLYQQALSIREKRLGPTHPETEVSRKAYAAFLRLAGLVK